VAPDIDGPFSREDSVREVEDVNTRNAKEVGTLYTDAITFKISLLTRFKIPSIKRDVGKYVPSSIPSAFRQ